MRFLKDSLARASLSILLSAAAILLGVGLIGTSAYLISFAALQPSIAVLQVAVVGVRFFGLSKSVMRYLERLASHSVNFKMLTRLRSFLFRGISARFPTHESGDSNARLLGRVMEDVETLEFFFIRVVNPPLAGLVTAFITALIFRGFQIRLLKLFLLLNLASMVLALLISYLLARGSSAGFIQTRSDLHAVIVEYLQGLPDLLVNQAAGHQLDSIRAAEGRFASAQRRLTLSGAISNGLVSLLTNASMLVMLVGGIVLINNGLLDPKLLAACALITVAAFDAVLPLPLAAQQYMLNEQAGRRILELTGDGENRPSVTLVELPIDHVDLNMEGVCFTHPGADHPVLENISLQLAPGRMTALVGPSGTGKTTLARLLLAYWPTSTGQITLAGRKYEDISPEQIRSRIAYSGQGAYFFNSSVRENLQMACPTASDADLNEILTACQLSEWFARLPEGLDTPLGERGLKISEGERRRLDLARTLMRDCPIVILDEPFAGLDSLTEAELNRSLRERLAGKAVLWITHRLAGLDMMDEIMVLQSGHIVERGRQTDLLVADTLFRRMRQVQQNLIE
jgi:ATP-binding cassette subfamily C protein CydC